MNDERFKTRIAEEVEEFLRDLTLEYPFLEIFETLRRREFVSRYGKTVMPLRNPKISADRIREIDTRIDQLILDLEIAFGPRYKASIDDSLRFYTQTTHEEPRPLSH